MVTFKDLWLHANLLTPLEAHGYNNPTPIQEQSIPIILSGKDMFGCAQTGTGKTAAFALPTLQLLSKKIEWWNNQKKIRSLILTPTRELAIQIAENYTKYGKHTGLRNTVIFWWVSQVPQVKTLRAGVDILIATPGRLLDLIQQKLVSLGHVEIFVLDEADRMLDMGFIRDIRKLLTHLPNKRQNLFFSATMAPEIMDLAHTILKNPESVKITPVSSTVDTVGQSLYTVSKENKKHLLLHLMQNQHIKNTIVFTKTKHWANKVEKILAQSGIPSAAIHGNKSQNARQQALANLKNGSVRALVATDIAARGIDVSQLSHVIIYDVPLEPESYVHRIWRTGRAGSTGDAMMFCEPDEVKYLKQITKLIGKDIPLVKDQPFHMDIDISWKGWKGYDINRSIQVKRPHANIKAESNSQNKHNSEWQTPKKKRPRHRRKRK